jgi:hypothetical protein
MSPYSQRFLTWLKLCVFWLLPVHSSFNAAVCVSVCVTIPCAFSTQQDASKFQKPVACLDAAARYKREAERLRVQEDLAETERKRNELRGLLAMYSNE